MDVGSNLSGGNRKVSNWKNDQEQSDEMCNREKKILVELLFSPLNLKLHTIKDAKKQINIE